MTCYANGNLHVCTPTISRVKKRRAKCPTCKARRTMVAFFEEWYGWTETCLGCGDTWTNGDMHERPFAPRWRKESIASARALLAAWNAKYRKGEG